MAAASLVPVGGVAHAETDPPGPVTSLQVFTHVGSATLTWLLPADADYADTVVQMKLGTSPPSSITDGVLVNDPDGSGPNPKVPNLVVPKPGNVTWVDGLDPGTNFTFGLFARDTSGNVSTVTSKTILGTDIALSVTRSTVTYGGSSTFKATLRRSTGTAAVAGVPVDFYVRQRGTKPWFFWQERTTNGAGVATAAFNPGLNIDVQAYFYGSESHLGTATSGVRVNVAHKVTAAVNYTQRKKGKKFTIRGSIASKAPGTAVAVQRYSKGAWRTVKSATLTNLRTSQGTTSGTFAYVVKPKKKGVHYYRVVKGASTKYVTSYSPTVRFRVT